MSCMSYVGQRQRSASGVSLQILKIQRRILSGPGFKSVQSTNECHACLMWVRDSEAPQVFLCRSSKSNGPTVNQPDRSTNAIFRQIIVYDAKKRNFVLETIYCKNYNHSHNSSLPQSRRFATGPLLVVIQVHARVSRVSGRPQIANR